MGICPSCLEPIPEGEEFCPTHRLMNDPLIGTLLAGSYQVDRMLGQGGMGRVYAGSDVRLDRRVAIKVLLSSADETSGERFQREARAVAALAHQNIVTIYDVGQLDGGRSYLVMEFLEGVSVEDRLRTTGAFELDAAASVVTQVAKALGAAHDKGLIHRDLKPENVMLVHRDGQDDFVKVLDFGLAKKFGEGSNDELGLTQTGFAMGTPAYMSPEQIVGPSVDHRADVYALGMLSFALICGRPAFKGATSQDVMIAQVRDEPPPPTSLRPGLNPRVDEVVLKALSKKPSLRYESVGELADALAAALKESDSIALAPPETKSDESVMPGQQGPQSTLSGSAAESLSAAATADDSGGLGKWIGLAAGLLIVAGGAVVFMMTGRVEPRDGVVHSPAVVVPSAPGAAIPNVTSAGAPTRVEDEPDAGTQRPDKPRKTVSASARKKSKSNRRKPAARRKPKRAAKPDVAAEAKPAPKPKPKAKPKAKSKLRESADELKIDLDL